MTTKTRAFWERNLRLKTDSSDDGPQKGVPALVPAGMVGDRADVILAAWPTDGRWCGTAGVHLPGVDRPYFDQHCDQAELMTQQPRTPVTIPARLVNHNKAAAC